MSDQKLKIAVFIDFDNVEIGVKTTLGLQFDIGAVLEAVKERGEVITKVAYGDWKRSGDYGRAMANHAVRLVQRVMTPGGDKNGADINLALDALEMAFTHSHINAFVIVGGDSDFITLVEKLKQYDRKVFVVGGRAFTSQVMQKNCTEFIAYENIVPDRRPSHPRHERGGERGLQHTPRTAGTQPIDQAEPLVRRALKVLADREVSPQLGLLKSTLLQLDSSFSERDYGVSSFRDFADKLAERGLVMLKHQGRSTMVELNETAGSAGSAGSTGSTGSTGSAGSAGSAGPIGMELLEAVDPVELGESGQADSVSAAREAGRRAARALLEEKLKGVASDDDPPQGEAPTEPVSLGDGVALVRKALSEVTTPPRWPMYPRQFKQFLKTVQPDFDERRYGSIADLMRACQKDGILRLERDRQGALRVFANGATARATVPHGWGLVVNNQPPVVVEVDGNIALPIAAEEIEVEPEPQPVVVAEAPAKPKRARKAPAAKKTAAKRVTKKKE
jgi:uncharacterized LabA/DUF88 family protein